MEQVERTQEDTMPMMPFESQANNSDFMKWVISGEELANAIEIQLLGKTWSYTEKRFIQVTKPLATKEFIGLVKSAIITNIGQATSVNRFKDEREIREIVGRIWQNMADMLYMKRKEWNVAKENLDFITITMIRNTIYYALKKSMEGEMITLLKPTIKRIENINAGQPGKQGGGFGSFLNPFK